MHIKVRDLTAVALMAAAICVFAPWSIPIGPVPITLATFAIYIVSAVVSWKHAVAAVLVYLLLGLVGLPVFSGFSGGLQQLAGPTGGYLIGYIPCALILGCAIDRFPRAKWMYPLAMLVGTAALYFLGTAWYVLASGVPTGPAILACVVPFLPFDGLKIILASLIAYPLRQRLTAAEKRA